MLLHGNMDFESYEFSSMAEQLAIGHYGLYDPDPDSFSDDITHTDITEEQYQATINRFETIETLAMNYSDDDWLYNWISYWIGMGGGLPTAVSPTVAEVQAQLQP